MVSTSDLAVLVVDDDEHAREIYSTVFSKESPFRVYVEADVESGLARLEATDDVRCILSDYLMPGRDGLAFAEAVRERGLEVPFVLLTGNGSEEVAASAFQAGVDDYFLKRPGRHRVLIRRVENLVDQYVAERALERERDRFQTLIEASTDLITILDEAGRYRYVSPAVEHVFGYRTAALLGDDAFDRVHPDDRDALRSRFETAVDSPDGSIEAVEYRHLTADGEYRWYESTGRRRREPTEGYVVNTRDITDRVRREASLEALNETMHHLIRAHPDQPLGELTTETAVDISAATNVSYYDWNDERGVLERRAATWADGGPPAVLDPDTPAWDAFVDDEPTRHSGSPASVLGAVPETDALLVPIARRGLLVFAKDEAFDTVDRYVAETLASGYRALLDRRAQTRRLGETERELRATNETLSRLDRVNEIIRNVGQALVRASDRGSVAEAVCAEFAATDVVGYTWFGVPDDDGGFDVLAWEGDDLEFLDRVAELNASTDEPPAATALCTQETQVVRDLLDDDRCEPIRRAALNRGLRGLVSCPITYNGETYGVLEVYVTTPTVLDGQGVGVVTDLCETIGYACSSILQRRRSGGREYVEVAVDVADVDDALAHLSARSGIPFTVTDAVGHPERWHATVEAPDGEAVAEHARDQRAVEYVDRLELHLDHFPVREVVGEFGGRFRRYDVDGTEATLVARLPQHVDVRAFVTALEAVGAGASLRRKERVTTGEPGAGLASVTDLLTPRQAEVLTYAYDCGYFESPREITGGEVAEALAISPPTFHDHRRKAINRIVTTLLEEYD